MVCSGVGYLNMRFAWFELDLERSISRSERCICCYDVVAYKDVRQGQSAMDVEV